MSPSREVTLTSHRLRITQGWRGRGNLISFGLEDLAGCELIRVSNPYLLFSGFSFLLLALGFYYAGPTVSAYILYNVNNFYYGPLALGGVMLLVYLITRGRCLRITSSGGVQILLRSYASYAVCVSLIDRIEEAKIQRLKTLHGHADNQGMKTQLGEVTGTHTIAS